MGLYDDAIKRAVEAADGEKLAGAKILITGATGLIGTALCDALLRAGARVYAACRSEERFYERFDGSGAVFYPYEIGKKLEGEYDYIVHAASGADPASFKTDPVGVMNANYIGLYNILEHMKKSGGRLLYVSTGEVYGQHDGVSDAFDESYAGRVDFTSPRGCYPNSKRAAENLAVCYGAQYGVDFVTARLSHTFGPTQTSRDSRAVSEFFSRAVKGEDIVLRSRGDQVRSYTCVFDAVGALLTLLLRGGRGEAYNVANKNSIASIAELAREIADCAGVKVVFDVEKPEAGKITRGVLDAVKLESLGWRGLYDLRAGVKLTYDIMKEPPRKRCGESARVSAPNEGKPKTDEMNERLEALLQREDGLLTTLSNAAALLNEYLDDINWVGFYILSDGALHLGPFQGKPACVRIPAGKGVCGAAVRDDETKSVSNVHDFPGHIACDSASNSEIVIPIHCDGKIAAVLDIDSPVLARFDASDGIMLEKSVKIIENAWSHEWF